MSKKERRDRRREKVRKLSGDEASKLGAVAWTNRAMAAKAEAVVFRRALELLYEDYNKAKPREPIEHYVDAAVQQLRESGQILAVQA